MNILKFHKKSGMTADTGLVCAGACRRLGGGNDCYSRLWLYCLILLFALTSCEKSDIATIDGDENTTRTVTSRELIGDWTIQSALVPVGTLSADIAWEGSMMEFSADSVRIHRLEYVYHSASDGGLEDVTIATYPVTYDKDKVIINDVPLTLVINDDGYVTLRNGEVYINIVRTK